MPDLTAWQWTLAFVAASGIGISKSGFAGFGLFHIVIFSGLFGARESTGILLPLLIVGDVTAVSVFRRHARWDYIRRILPPAVVGVVVGWWMMGRLDDTTFKPLIGAIILLLAVLQAARMWKPAWFSEIPHARAFAWTLGFTAGMTTMLANAAGPIVAIYLVAVSLPKYEFVGTSAWFFLIINVLKIPFSTGLGLIRPDTLSLNLTLAPAVVAGLLVGRKLVHYIPQRLFDSLLLTFAAVAGLRMVGVF
ncbi:MAG: sulfite exporter TauE/SafE family protein [Planctomycetia bacterium]|nr:sulfite exporter TauE/SafE family protein [Planctomycetia bacterium]